MNSIMKFSPGDFVGWQRNGWGLVVSFLGDERGPTIVLDGKTCTLLSINIDHMQVNDITTFSRGTEDEA